MITLGEALRILRGDMSLRDAQKLTGISHTYLDRLEKGFDPRTGKEIAPSVSVLRNIANAYNVPVELMLALAGYIDESVDPALAEAISEINGKLDRAAILEVALEYQSKARRGISGSDDVDSFLTDAESLSVDELMDKFALRVDGKLVTRDEMEEAIAYIRARRIMKDQSM